MPRQDTVDFVAAFAVGTVLGIGATLLLQPDDTPQERVTKKLKPYKKQLRKNYRNISKEVRESGGATSDLTAEVIDAGRELLGEFRTEVADILDGARADLRDLVDDQLKELGKSAKRTRRRVGL